MTKISLYWIVLCSGLLILKTAHLVSCSEEEHAEEEHDEEEHDENTTACRSEVNKSKVLSVILKFLAPLSLIEETTLKSWVSEQLP